MAELLAALNQTSAATSRGLRTAVVNELAAQNDRLRAENAQLREENAELLLELVDCLHELECTIAMFQTENRMKYPRLTSRLSHPPLLCHRVGEARECLTPLPPAVWHITLGRQLRGLSRAIFEWPIAPVVSTPAPAWGHWARGLERREALEPKTRFLSVWVAKHPGVHYLGGFPPTSR